MTEPHFPLFAGVPLLATGIVTASGTRIGISYDDTKREQVHRYTAYKARHVMFFGIKRRQNLRHARLGTFSVEDNPFLL